MLLFWKFHPHLSVKEETTYLKVTKQTPLVIKTMRCAWKLWPDLAFHWWLPITYFLWSRRTSPKGWGRCCPLTEAGTWPLRSRSATTLATQFWGGSAIKAHKWTEKKSLVPLRNKKSVWYICCWAQLTDSPVQVVDVVERRRLCEAHTCLPDVFTAVYRLHALNWVLDIVTNNII